jgi:hypothetical protein
MRRRPYAVVPNGSSCGPHPDGGLIASYAQGVLPFDQVGPVEGHLDRCADCRGELAGDGEPGVTEVGWQRLSDLLDVPSRSLPERLVLRLGVPEHMARLALATPVLRRSWLVASLVTFDPMYELGLVMPIHGLRLILFRSTTVLIASTALSALFTLAVPARSLVVFGWLAPSLAVTALTLALSAFLDPLVAAKVTGAGWLAAAAVAGEGGVSHSALLTFPGQVTVAALALLAAVFVAAQRHRFEQAVRARRPGHVAA